MSQSVYSVAATAVVVVLASGSPAGALEKCKVKVDKKTGVVSVSARGVSGPLLWGAQVGQEVNAFFNDATCVAGGSAKRCQFDDPAALAAKTPPPGCTVYLDDGVSPACSAWVSGCTPGVRDETFITNDELADDAVTTEKVLDGSLTGADIADQTILNADLAPNSVGEDNIIDDSINDDDIADESLTGTDIEDGTITGADIADDSILNADLAPNSVGGDNIIDESINNEDISDESLTGDDIANGTITAADVLSSSIQLRITGSCAPGTHISRINANGTVVCD